MAECGMTDSHYLHTGYKVKKGQLHDVSVRSLNWKRYNSKKNHYSKIRFHTQ